MMRSARTGSAGASTIQLHGHPVSYRQAGDSGPVVLLVHGIAASSTTWDDVLPALGRHATAIAPDLLGHGASAKPRGGDYSLGAYASGLRDLLVALGHERATIVGHSLGGGVALQLAYQHPERCERLVLVGAGGFGREVHTLLRAAALPGSEWLLPVVCASMIGCTGNTLARVLGRLGLHARVDVAEMWAAYTSLSEAAARRAFLHTLRGLVDVGGQRVSAAHLLYLAEHIPTLLVCGDRDPIIPAAHTRRAHELMPGSRLEVFSGAGHYPHREYPRRFAELLVEFLLTTKPASTEPDWRALLTRTAESA